jgi:putative phosphoribosyl transferase
VLFNDRKEAGAKLAEKLSGYRRQPQTVVVGLARGGVVVAHAVAAALGLPLDVIVIRKVGAPHHEELALGAVDEEGHGVFNEDIIQELGITSAYVKEETERQKKIAHDRAAKYRGNKQTEIKGKTAIIVDDGIATGASMRAAILGLRKKGAKKIVLAVPVAAPESLMEIAPEVDETVCLYAPGVFMAVGQFYRDFDQTSDEEVIRLLECVHKAF